MDYTKAKAYLLSKPEAEESYPFGPDAAVFKVMNKVYAILGIEDGIGRLNLKCDPLEAIQLRDVFDAVIPGYHMNKKHWNTVILNGSIPPGEVTRQIDHSYGLIFKALKKTDKAYLERLYPMEQLNPDHWILLPEVMKR